VANKSGNTAIYQTWRFFLVGVATTLVHFVVLSVCFRVLGYAIVPSTIMAFFIAVVFSYLMSYRFTFRSTQMHRSSVPKFLLSVGLGFSWNVGLMYLLVEHIGIDYVFAFLLTTMVVMVNNFILTKFWVFKS